MFPAAVEQPERLIENDMTQALDACKTKNWAGCLRQDVPMNILYHWQRTWTKEISMLLTRPLIGLANFLLMAIVVSATSVSAQQPTDYFTAYKKAQEGDRPMLVLVTAEWCPPCKVMKSTTIPELMKRNAFSQFHYATVDLDAEQRLARQLIGDRGVPQLIMFEKQNGEWVRRYLRGIQTPATVEAFVAQSAFVRTANATAVLNK